MKRLTPEEKLSRVVPARITDPEERRGAIERAIERIDNAIREFARR